MIRFAKVPYPYPVWPVGVRPTGRTYYLDGSNYMLELEITGDAAFDALEAMVGVLIFDHVATAHARIPADRRQKMKDAGINISPGQVVGDALEDFFAANGHKFRA